MFAMRLAAVSTLLATCLHGVAQTTPSVKETIPFPDGSGRVAVFTERWIPLSEPPRPDERLGVTVKAADGSAVASAESEPSSGFLTRAVVVVNGTPAILLGVKTLDGPGNRLYAYRLEGRTLVRSGTWAGAAFDFSTTPEGTLRVVISQAYEPGKFPWNGRGVSRIYLWNGNYNREDLEGEKPLLNKLMDDVSVEIDSLHVEEFNNGKYGNNVDLENACGRALEAEVVLGDPARALRLCAAARKKIQDCCFPSSQQRVDSDLNSLDRMVDSYRRNDPDPGQRSPG